MTMLFRFDLLAALDLSGVKITVQKALLSIGLASPLLWAMCVISIAQNSSLPIPAKYLVPSPPKRLALVIGNSDYKDAEPLPGARADVASVVEKLKGLNFTVTPVENFATRGDFLQDLQPFLSHITENSIVVFYYSGHGFSVGNDTYLVPLQFPDSITDIFDTFLSSSAIWEQILDRHPAILVFLLDSCRTNSSFVKRFAPSTAAQIQKGFATLGALPSEDLVVGYATEPGQTAGGGPAGQMSPFTSALVKFIDSQDMEWSLAEKRITAEVRTTTHNANPPQNPWFSATIASYVYMNYTKNVEDRELQDWKAILSDPDLDRSMVYQFLMLHDAGSYASVARQWLADHPTDPPKTGTNWFTQVSPAAPDDLWNTVVPAHGLPPTVPNEYSVPQSYGPIALGRYATESMQFDSASANTMTAAEVTADILNRAGVGVAVASAAAHIQPTSDSPIVRQLHIGERLRINSIEREQIGQGLWANVSAIDGKPTSTYVRLPDLSAPPTKEIGRPLLEVQIGSPTEGLPSSIDEKSLSDAINNLRGAGHEISWVSVGAPTATDERGKLVNFQKVINAAFVLHQNGIGQEKITSIAGSSPDIDSLRIRFFGK